MNIAGAHLAKGQNSWSFIIVADHSAASDLTGDFAAASFSKLGGEIEINLALTQNALGKEEDSIETFKWLEQNHTLRKTRQQAEHLRYILEAPKLELNEDEYIKIPSMSNVATPYRCELLVSHKQLVASTLRTVPNMHHAFLCDLCLQVQWLVNSKVHCECRHTLEHMWQLLLRVTVLMFFGKLFQ